MCIMFITIHPSMLNIINLGPITFNEGRHNKILVMVSHLKCTFLSVKGKSFLRIHEVCHFITFHLLQIKLVNYSVDLEIAYV